ncbi:uncharacterized protein GJ701_003289 isoform 1-T1 [Geothlypis trichas]
MELLRSGEAGNSETELSRWVFTDTLHARLLYFLCLSLETCLKRHRSPWSSSQNLDPKASLKGLHDASFFPGKASPILYLQYSSASPFWMSPPSAIHISRGTQILRSRIKRATFLKLLCGKRGLRKQVPTRREEKESAHKPQKDVQTEVLRRMEMEMEMDMDMKLQGKIMLELQECHCKTQAM